MTTEKGTDMTTLTRMTWEEIEHAAANSGRCIVRYGQTDADSEAATVIRFEFTMKSMTRKVFVRFDDGMECDYFIRDIYRMPAGA